MSGFRSILLHLDATPGSSTRLVLAHALAERHDAQLTVLFGTRPEAQSAAYAYSASAALRAAEEFQDAPQERSRLRELCSEIAPRSVWCEVSGDTVAHAFRTEAAYADLLILGQQPSADSSGSAPPGFVESMILDSGTPAIVLPYPVRQQSIGDRVLVAWNGSAQAARALRAALPVLEHAAEVHVVSWSAPPPSAPFSRLDVGSWLSRHGIVSHVDRRDPCPNVAHELASLSAALKADLVVMGCYGHSRIRERVFGGVTRSSLADLPVPVLMAH